MHIIELQVENYKRLRAARVTPEGRIVDIVGRNGQGKSSLLDSIYAVLAGASALPSKPIKKGAKSATIVVKIGDADVKMVVKRHFSRRDDDSYLTSVTVENADGAMYRSPQTMLDGLLDAISFDPLAFARMKPAEQLLEVRKLVPGLDFDAIDAEQRGDYQRRQDVNRRAKETSAELNALRIPGDPNSKPIDEAALVAALVAAGDTKAAIEKERARRQTIIRNARLEELRAEDLRRENGERRAEIDSLKARIELMERELAIDIDRAAVTQENGKRLQAEAEALPPLDLEPDTAELQSRIESARKANAEHTERERVIARGTELREKLTKLTDDSEALTATMAKRTREMGAAIAAANLPVEGLAFTDNEVTLNGFPFEQASDAEKLRASIALIAARQPKLRVVRVGAGAGMLFDVDALKALGELAEKYDLQIWREVVQDGTKTGIIIEDGEVVPASA